MPVPTLGEGGRERRSGKQKGGEGIRREGRRKTGARRRGARARAQGREPEPSWGRGKAGPAAGGELRGSAPGERGGRSERSAGRRRPRPAPPARNSSPKVAARLPARNAASRQHGHPADQGQPGGESQPRCGSRYTPRTARLLGVAAAARWGQGGARGRRRGAAPLPPARRHGPGAAADGAPGPAGGGRDAAAAPAPGERKEGTRGARRLWERPAPSRGGRGAQRGTAQGPI